MRRSISSKAFCLLFAFAAHLFKSVYSLMAFICYPCNRRTFTTQNDFKRHLENYFHGPYECEICFNRFRFPSLLADHIEEIHQQEEPEAEDIEQEDGNRHKKDAGQKEDNEDEEDGGQEKENQDGEDEDSQAEGDAGQEEDN